MARSRLLWLCTISRKYLVNDRYERPQENNNKVYHYCSSQLATSNSAPWDEVNATSRSKCIEQFRYSVRTLPHLVCQNRSCHRESMLIYEQLEIRLWISYPTSYNERFGMRGMTPRLCSRCLNQRNIAILFGSHELLILISYVDGRVPSSLHTENAFLASASSKLAVVCSLKSHWRIRAHVSQECSAKW